MRKLIKYLAPLVFLTSGCAYYINMINPRSNYIYQKIDKTPFTLSLRIYGTKTNTRQALQSRINIISYAAQEKKITLEKMCEKIDTNKPYLNISEKEFDKFLDEYAQTK